MYLSWCPDHYYIEHQNVSEYFIIVTCKGTDGIAASKNIKFVVSQSAFRPSTDITITSGVPTEMTLSTGKFGSVLLSQPLIKAISLLSKPGQTICRPIPSKQHHVDVL